MKRKFPFNFPKIKSLDFVIILFYLNIRISTRYYEFNIKYHISKKISE